MINASNEFKKLNIGHGKRAYQEYADITLADGTELHLTNKHLWNGGLSIEDAASSNNSFDIGSAIINKCTLTVNNIYDNFSEYEFEGAKVVTYIGLALDEINEFVGKNLIRGTNAINSLIVTTASWENGLWREASGGSGTRESIQVKDAPDPSIKLGWRFTKNDNSATDIAQDFVPVTYGQKYTMSCYARCTSGQVFLRMQTWRATGTASHVKTVAMSAEANGKWSRYSFTFTHDFADYKDATNIYFGSGKSNGTLEICGMKLELGEADTGYTIAPEDIRVEKLRKGTFTVNDPKNNGSIITLECLDNMQKFDKSYSMSKLPYPASLGAIVRDACSVCGVTLQTSIFPHDDFVVENKPTAETTTFREVISWAAQIAGCFCRCDAYGRLELKWYDLNALENPKVVDWSIGENLFRHTKELSGNSKYVAYTSKGTVTVDSDGYGIFTVPADGNYNSIDFYFADVPVSEIAGKQVTISAFVKSDGLTTLPSGFQIVAGVFTSGNIRRRYAGLGNFSNESYNVQDYADGEWVRIIRKTVLPAISKMYVINETVDYVKYGIQFYVNSSNTAYPLQIKKVKCEFGVVDDPVYTESPSDENAHWLRSHYSSPTVSLDDVVITGVRVTEKTESSESEDQLKNYQSGTDGYVISVENNSLIKGGAGKQIADWLGSQIIGMRFRKATLNHTSDPTIEAGDIAVVTDRKGNNYNIVVTATKFSTGGAQSTACSAQSPARNSSERYSAETKNYVELRRKIQKEKTDRELALEQLSKHLAESTGVFTTIEKMQDGSNVYYLHNKPTLAESDMVWKMTAEAWGVSTDGGKTWNGGMTVDGDTIVRILNATGVNADWINAGAITVKDASGNILFSVDMDTKQVIISGDCIRIGSKSVTTVIHDSTQEAKQYTDTAKAAAISTAASDASQKASAAQSAAISAASTDATNKANSALENAKKYMDALEIGGAQILRGTNTVTTLTSTGTWSAGTWRKASNPDSTGNTRTSIAVTDAPNANIKVGWEIKRNGSGAIDIAQDAVPVTNGKTYTLSCYAKGTGAIRLQYGKSPYPSKQYTLSNVTRWTRYSYTFTIGAQSDGSTDGSTNIYIGCGANGTIQVCGMKLETGNKATDWSPAPEDTETYADNLAADLQAQIDGKIETYNQASDPSSPWTTADIKTKHTGDLWYNSSTKETKRWSGTAWATLSNKEAEDAASLAQSKAQVFIITPTIPYYKGDLWFNSATSDILTCLTTRTSGSYTAADWGKRNKYTDDTFAKSVQSNLDNLSIGGRNLARGTSSEYSAPFSSFNGSANVCPYVAKVYLNGLSVGDAVTVHIFYKYENIVAASGQTAQCWLQGNGNITGWGGGQFLGSSRLTISGSGTHEFLYKFTLTAEQAKNEYWYINFRHDYVQSGSVRWKMFKVEKGDKATDWTPAPEDYEASVDAKLTKYSTTSEMESAINTTKSEITASVSEKYTTKAEFSTANGKITNLTTRMSSAESKLTKDSLVTTIGEYYTTKTYVDTAKSSAISTAASDATNKANAALANSKEYTDSIQIGGRNLVLKSATLAGYFSQLGGYSGERKVVEDAEALSGVHIEFKCTTAGAGWHCSIFSKTADRIGKTFTWSFYAKCSVAKSGSVGSETGGQTNINLTTAWKKYAYTWTMLDTQYQSFTFYLGWHVGEIFYIRDFKIEEGNKATAWTAAPEDTDETIESTKTIATQTANKFNWIVKSGTSATDFTLTDRTASLVAQTINLNGLVSFSGLDSAAQSKITTAQSTANAAKTTADSNQSTIANWCYNNNKTYINGGKIYTGSITTAQLAANCVTAAKINTADLFAQDITASGTIRGVNLVGAKGSFSGDVTANSFKLNGSSLKMQKITFAFNDYTYGEQQITDTCLFISPDGSFNINDYAGGAYLNGTSYAWKMAISTLSSTDARISYLKVDHSISASTISSSMVSASINMSAPVIYENGTALSSKYSQLGHTHSYLPTTGGTVSGTVTFSGSLSVAVANFWGTTAFHESISVADNSTKTTSIKLPYLKGKSTTTGNHLVIKNTTNYEVSYLASSSKRYKDIYRELTESDVSSLYDVKVVLAKYKDWYLDKTDERYGKFIPMFIAEDVDANFPLAADHSDGLPENWNERIIIPSMLKLLQLQHDDIQRLKGKNASLAGENNSLLGRVCRLEQLVQTLLATVQPQAPEI